MSNKMCKWKFRYNVLTASASVALLGSRTLAAIRRTEMSFGISLSNWVVMLVFLLGLLGNANAQTTNNSTEDFETNDFSKFPWEHPVDASWTITSYENNSGTYSARAGTIDHRESTTLQVTLDCISGDITFYRKVSSESGFDYLKFYIDGVEKATGLLKRIGPRCRFQWMRGQEPSSEPIQRTARSPEATTRRGLMI